MTIPQPSAEAAHTPGPWLLQEEDGDWSIWIRQPLGTLATFYPNDMNVEFPAKANATLARAAPELLKYLSIFLGHDDRFQVSVGGNPIAVDRMLEEARAALLKAQGRSA